MPAKLCSDKRFIELWIEHGAPTAVARVLKCTSRAVHDMREAVQNRTGIKLATRKDNGIIQAAKDAIQKYPGRLFIEINDGTVIVFSDAHYWPDTISTAHRALLVLIKKLKPKAIVCNGDAFDGGSISRFPRIGWDSKPSVMDELAVVRLRLGEIAAAGRGAKKIWTLGNHDSRYETFLAARVPEFQGVQGFTLKEHFLDWAPCWTAWINSESYMPTCVTHRYKGGIHATHNNAVNSGINYVTGHLHSLKVTPFTDLRGTRFGVDTGTLADPDGVQFMDYTEDKPKNHRSGFAVLTYVGGHLLWPEIVHVLDDCHVEFRGEILEV